MTGTLPSDWLSGFLLRKGKGGGHFFFKFPHSFVICNRTILRDLFEKEYHSSVSFDPTSKSVLEIK